jgi:uncharacterized coiled-coil protein SlyX
MFENPDNERRVNELEVELSELSDEVGLLNLLLTKAREELYVQQELMAAMAQAIGHVSEGEKFGVEIQNKRVILSHIPTKLPNTNYL